MQLPPPTPPNKEGPFLPCLERQGLPGPISVKKDVLRLLTTCYRDTRKQPPASSKPKTHKRPGTAIVSPSRAWTDTSRITSD